MQKVAAKLHVLVLVGPKTRLDVVTGTWAAGVPNVHFVGQCAECDVRTTVQESWFTLPEKVMNMWSVAGKQFPQGQLFLKIDSDAYVFYPRLLRLLADHEAKHGSLPDYLGFVDSTYPEDWSLQYASGGAGYVLSARAIHVLLACKEPLLPYEDAHVGRCLRAAGVKPTHSPQFSPVTLSELLQLSMEAKDPTTKIVPGWPPRGRGGTEGALLQPITLHGYKNPFDMLALHALLHYDGGTAADAGKPWLPFEYQLKGSRK